MKKWAIATAIRCVRTMAQAALGVIGASYVLSEVDFTIVVSASVLAGIVCILTCLAGLPEVDGGKHSV